jgi:hypothetical protein
MKMFNLKQMSRKCRIFVTQMYSTPLPRQMGVFGRKAFVWVFPNIFSIDFVAFALLMDIYVSIIAATSLYPNHVLLRTILVINSVLTVGLYTAWMVNSRIEVKA